VASLTRQRAPLLRHFSPIIPLFWTNKGFSHGHVFPLCNHVPLLLKETNGSEFKARDIRKLGSTLKCEHEMHYFQDVDKSYVEVFEKGSRSKASMNFTFETLKAVVYWLELHNSRMVATWTALFFWNWFCKSDIACNCYIIKKSRVEWQTLTIYWTFNSTFFSKKADKKPGGLCKGLLY
jgi:hypothetical protein